MTLINLFTSNSKKMSIIKRFASVCLIVAILGVSVNALNRMYFSEEDWSRILWRSFYKQENIDNVFVGSSHVYCDVNPFLLDEINGMNNFNLAAGSIGLCASYYMLKEAGRKYDLSNVYLELYYGTNAGSEEEDDDRTIKNVWRVASYLRPSINKYEYIFSTLDSSHYLETLVPFVRYRSHLFDGEYISNLRNKIKSDSYKNYEFIDETDAGTIEYMEKGFYRTTETIETSNAYFYRSKMNLKTDGLMTDNNRKYLMKIIEYCKEKNINIKLFISPSYATQNLSSEDYDAYYSQVSSIAKDNNVEFYDFNLCKPDYLDIMKADYFSDNGHLNEAGANIFTPFLWEVLTKSATDNKELFCDSYKERMAREESTVYGVYYVESDEEKDCVIASNDDSDMEYKVVFVPTKDESDRETVILQDFSTNKGFVLPNSLSGGKLCIDARMKSSGERVKLFEIELE